MAIKIPATLIPGDGIGPEIVDAALAVAHRLPSMFGWSEYCDAGGLLSYGANQRATYFWLATYADRILRGEKPVTIQSPSRPLS